MINIKYLQEPESTTHPKWFNSPVTSYVGNVTEIRSHIPVFEERPFGLAPVESQSSRNNEKLNVIIRLPHGNDNNFVPVNVVSKNYTLVQHIDVFDTAVKALESSNIDLDNVAVQLKITQYGERISLNMYLPDNYNFDPGDGHPMALRFECLNSIDGSTRFRVLAGWFRFVCSNGLIVGKSYSDVHRRHIGNIRLEDVQRTFESIIEGAENDRSQIFSWRKTEITIDALKPWIEGSLCKAWGLKAAVRAFHIALHGWDVNITDGYREKSLTNIQVKRVQKVPGAPEECRNLYDLSQILAWLASERRDVQEQLEWREKIPELITYFPL